MTVSASFLALRSDEIKAAFPLPYLTFSFSLEGIQPS